MDIQLITDKLKNFLKILKQDGIYGYDSEILEILDIIKNNNNT